MTTRNVQIPKPILSKIVNRRRRMVRIIGLDAPPSLIEREQALLNDSVDELCAFFEEHADHIFYTKKGGADEDA